MLLPGVHEGGPQMKALDLKQTEELLRFTAQRIMDSKDLLTEVDSRIGDGDHGIGMELGMRKAVEALDKQKEPVSVNDLFKTVGRAMLMSMGGASGVIFGTLFQGGAKTAPVSGKLDAAALRSLFRGSLEAIKARGGARRGDKTMVDALEPAVIAMEESESDDLESLLLAATKAAAEGVEATKGYEARFGRAKSLMSRSIGYQDAGATSTWLIFQAMYDFVSGL